MAEIQNVDRLLGKLAKRMQDYAGPAGEPVVAVGYTAAYALWVHENLEMKWRGLPRGSGFSIDDQGRVRVTKAALSGKVSFKKHGFYWDPQGRGQSKFLETPLRTHKEVLAAIVVEMLSKGKTLSQALLAAGLRLQRESQLLVPVDTGNLKASAFTRLEHGSTEGATEL